MAGIVRVAVADDRSLMVLVDWVGFEVDERTWEPFKEIFEAAPEFLSDELRRPEVWKKNVEEWRESDFEAGKTVWKKQMRLFLICAHTHQLVPCGHNGRGYDIQRLSLIHI